MSSSIIHSMKHRKERLHICKICGKGHSSKRGLAIHANIHTREELYKCEVCLENFSSYSVLRAHRRFHLEAKQLACRVCTKQFSSQLELSSHTLIHKAERPYECDKCGKKIDRQTLQYQMIIQTSEKLYICNMCFERSSKERLADEQNKTQSNKKDHKKSHSRTKTYLCHLCSSAFSRKQDLEKHSEKHIQDRGKSMLVEEMAEEEDILTKTPIHVEKDRNYDETAASHSSLNYFTNMKTLIKTKEECLNNCSSSSIAYIRNEDNPLQTAEVSVDSTPQSSDGIQNHCTTMPKVDKFQIAESVSDCTSSDMIGFGKDDKSNYKTEIFTLDNESDSFIERETMFLQDIRNFPMIDDTAIEEENDMLSLLSTDLLHAQHQNLEEQQTCDSYSQMHVNDYFNIGLQEIARQYEDNDLLIAEKFEADMQNELVLSEYNDILNRHFKMGYNLSDSADSETSASNIDNRTTENNMQTILNTDANITYGQSGKHYKRIVNLNLKSKDAAARTAADISLKRFTVNPREIDGHLEYVDIEEQSTENFTRLLINDHFSIVDQVDEDDHFGDEEKIKIDDIKKLHPLPTHQINFSKTREENSTVHRSEVRHLNRDDVIEDFEKTCRNEIETKNEFHSDTEIQKVIAPLFVNKTTCGRHVNDFSNYNFKTKDDSKNTENTIHISDTQHKSDDMLTVVRNTEPNSVSNAKKSDIGKKCCKNSDSKNVYLEMVNAKNDPHVDDHSKILEECYENTDDEMEHQEIDFDDDSLIPVNISVNDNIIAGCINSGHISQLVVKNSVLTVHLDNEEFNYGTNLRSEKDICDAKSSVDSPAIDEKDDRVFCKSDDDKSLSSVGCDDLSNSSNSQNTDIRNLHEECGKDQYCEENDKHLNDSHSATNRQLMKEYPENGPSLTVHGGDESDSKIIVNKDSNDDYGGENYTAGVYVRIDCCHEKVDDIVDGHLTITDRKNFAQDDETATSKTIITEMQDLSLTAKNYVIISRQIYEDEQLDRDKNVIYYRVVESDDKDDPNEDILLECDTQDDKIAISSVLVQDTESDNRTVVDDNSIIDYQEVVVKTKVTRRENFDDSYLDIVKEGSNDSEMLTVDESDDDEKDCQYYEGDLKEDKVVVRQETLTKDSGQRIQIFYNNVSLVNNAREIEMQKKNTGDCENGKKINKTSLIECQEENVNNNSYYGQCLVKDKHKNVTDGSSSDMSSQKNVSQYDENDSPLPLDSNLLPEHKENVSQCIEKRDQENEVSDNILNDANDNLFHNSFECNLNRVLFESGQPKRGNIDRDTIRDFPKINETQKQCFEEITRVKNKSDDSPAIEDVHHMNVRNSKINSLHIEDKNEIQRECINLEQLKKRNPISINLNVDCKDIPVAFPLTDIRVSKHNIHEYISKENGDIEEIIDSETDQQQTNIVNVEEHGIDSVIDVNRQNIFTQKFGINCNPARNNLGIDETVMSVNDKLTFEDDSDDETVESLLTDEIFVKAEDDSESNLIVIKEQCEHLKEDNSSNYHSIFSDPMEHLEIEIVDDLSLLKDPNVENLERPRDLPIAVSESVSDDMPTSHSRNESKLSKVIMTGKTYKNKSKGLASIVDHLKSGISIGSEYIPTLADTGYQDVAVSFHNTCSGAVAGTNCDIDRNKIKNCFDEMACSFPREINQNILNTSSEEVTFEYADTDRMNGGLKKDVSGEKSTLTEQRYESLKKNFDDENYSNNFEHSGMSCPKNNPPKDQISISDGGIFSKIDIPRFNVSENVKGCDDVPLILNVERNPEKTVTDGSQETPTSNRGRDCETFIDPELKASILISEDLISRNQITKFDGKNETAESAHVEFALTGVDQLENENVDIQNPETNETAFFKVNQEHANMDLENVVVKTDILENFDAICKTIKKSNFSVNKSSFPEGNSIREKFANESENDISIREILPKDIPYVFIEQSSIEPSVIITADQGSYFGVDQNTLTEHDEVASTSNTKKLDSDNSQEKNSSIETIIDQEDSSIIIQGVDCDTVILRCRPFFSKPQSEYFPSVRGMVEYSDENVTHNIINNESLETDQPIEMSQGHLNTDRKEAAKRTNVLKHLDTMKMMEEDDPVEKSTSTEGILTKGVNESEKDNLSDMKATTEGAFILQNEIREKFQQMSELREIVDLEQFTVQKGHTQYTQSLELADSTDTVDTDCCVCRDTFDRSCEICHRGSPLSISRPITPLYVKRDGAETAIPIIECVNSREMFIRLDVVGNISDNCVENVSNISNNEPPITHVEKHSYNFESENAQEIKNAEGICSNDDSQKISFQKYKRAPEIVDSEQNKVSVKGDSDTIDNAVRNEAIEINNDLRGNKDCVIDASDIKGSLLTIKNSTKGNITIKDEHDNFTAGRNDKIASKIFNENLESFKTTSVEDEFGTPVSIIADERNFVEDIGSLKTATSEIPLNDTDSRLNNSTDVDDKKTSQGDNLTVDRTIDALQIDFQNNDESDTASNNKGLNVSIRGHECVNSERVDEVCYNDDKILNIPAHDSSMPNRIVIEQQNANALSDHNEMDTAGIDNERSSNMNTDCQVILPIPENIAMPVGIVENDSVLTSDIKTTVNESPSDAIEIKHECGEETIVRRFIDNSIAAFDEFTQLTNTYADAITPINVNQTAGKQALEEQHFHKHNGSEINVFQEFSTTNKEINNTMTVLKVSDSNIDLVEDITKLEDADVSINSKSLSALLKKSGVLNQLMNVENYASDKETDGSINSNCTERRAVKVESFPSEERMYLNNSDNTECNIKICMKYPSDCSNVRSQEDTVSVHRTHTVFDQFNLDDSSIDEKCSTEQLPVNQIIVDIQNERCNTYECSHNSNIVVQEALHVISNVGVLNALMNIRSDVVKREIAEGENSNCPEYNTAKAELHVNDNAACNDETLNMECNKSESVERPNELSDMSSRDCILPICKTGSTTTILDRYDCDGSLIEEKYSIEQLPTGRQVADFRKDQLNFQSCELKQEPSNNSVEVKEEFSNIEESNVQREIPNNSNIDIQKMLHIISNVGGVLNELMDIKSSIAEGNIEENLKHIECQALNLESDANSQEDVIPLTGHDRPGSSNSSIENISIKQLETLTDCKLPTNQKNTELADGRLTVSTDNNGNAHRSNSEIGVREILHGTGSDTDVVKMKEELPNIDEPVAEQENLKRTGDSNVSYRETSVLIEGIPTEVKTELFSDETSIIQNGNQNIPNQNCSNSVDDTVEIEEEFSDIDQSTMEQHCHNVVDNTKIDYQETRTVQPCITKNETPNYLNQNDFAPIDDTVEVKEELSDTEQLNLEEENSESDVQPCITKNKTPNYLNQNGFCPIDDTVEVKEELSDTEQLNVEKENSESIENSNTNWQDAIVITAVTSIPIEVKTEADVEQENVNIIQESNNIEFGETADPIDVTLEIKQELLDIEYEKIDRARLECSKLDCQETIIIIDESVSSEVQDELPHINLTHSGVEHDEKGETEIIDAKNDGNENIAEMSSPTAHNLTEVEIGVADLTDNTMSSHHCQSNAANNRINIDTSDRMTFHCSTEVGLDKKETDLSILKHFNANDNLVILKQIDKLINDGDVNETMIATQNDILNAHHPSVDVDLDRIVKNQSIEPVGASAVSDTSNVSSNLIEKTADVDESEVFDDRLIIDEGIIEEQLEEPGLLIDYINMDNSFIEEVCRSGEPFPSINDNDHTIDLENCQYIDQNISTDEVDTQVDTDKNANLKTQSDHCYALNVENGLFKDLNSLNKNKVVKVLVGIENENGQVVYKEIETKPNNNTCPSIRNTDEPIDIPKTGSVQLSLNEKKGSTARTEPTDIIGWKKYKRFFSERKCNGRSITKELLTKLSDNGSDVDVVLEAMKKSCPTVKNILNEKHTFRQKLGSLISNSGSVDYLERRNREVSTAVQIFKKRLAYEEERKEFDKQYDVGRNYADRMVNAESFVKIENNTSDTGGISNAVDMNFKVVNDMPVNVEYSDNRIVRSVKKTCTTMKWHDNIISGNISPISHNVARFNGEDNMTVVSDSKNRCDRPIIISSISSFNEPLISQTAWKKVESFLKSINNIPFLKKTDGGHQTEIGEILLSADEKLQVNNEYTGLYLKTPLKSTMTLETDRKLCMPPPITQSVIDVERYGANYVGETSNPSKMFCGTEEIQRNYYSPTNKDSIVRTPKNASVRLKRDSIYTLQKALNSNRVSSIDIMSDSGLKAFIRNKKSRIIPYEKINTSKLNDKNKDKITINSPGAENVHISANKCNTSGEITDSFLSEDNISDVNICSQLKPVRKILKYIRRKEGNTTRPLLENNDRQFFIANTVDAIPKTQNNEFDSNSIVNGNNGIPEIVRQINNVTQTVDVECVESIEDLIPKCILSKIDNSSRISIPEISIDNKPCKKINRGTSTEECFTMDVNRVEDIIKNGQARQDNENILTILEMYSFSDETKNKLTAVNRNGKVAIDDKAFDELRKVIDEIEIPPEMLQAKNISKLLRNNFYCLKKNNEIDAELTENIYQSRDIKDYFLKNINSRAVSTDLMKDLASVLKYSHKNSSFPSPRESSRCNVLKINATKRRLSYPPSKIIEQSFKKKKIHLDSELNSKTVENATSTKLTETSNRSQIENQILENFHDKESPKKMFNNRDKITRSNDLMNDETSTMLTASEGTASIDGKTDRPIVDNVQSKKIKVVIRRKNLEAVDMLEEKNTADKIVHESLKPNCVSNEYIKHVAKRRKSTKEGDDLMELLSKTRQDIESALSLSIMTQENISNESGKGESAGLVTTDESLDPSHLKHKDMNDIELLNDMKDSDDFIVVIVGDNNKETGNQELPAVESVSVEVIDNSKIKTRKFKRKTKKIYNSATGNRARQRRNYGVKEFPCPRCDKVCKFSNALLVHMRIHTNERPFACDICDKRFKVKSALSCHYVVHTAERPFQCETCAKLFKTKTVLESHMKFHIGEKRFECDVCGKKFNQKQGLMIHLNLHTGATPWACDICFKRFKQPATLVKHHRIHTHKRPFKCKECKKIFETLGGLKVHFKAHHNHKFKERGIFKSKQK